MRRRTFLSASLVGVGATFTGIFDPLYAQISSGTSGIARAMSLNLSGPGRIGFYVDYSERSTVGTHRFYVCRTHGTAGTVSVQYSTSGDAHNTVSGTLTWDDGDADVKFFTVDVSSKQDGTHRIHATLSAPTGGAALQFGSQHTVAYGVIEDGTVSTDAVFFDASAADGGDGSIGQPYNSIHTAIANIGSARHLYCQGTVTIDASNTDSVFGVSHEAIKPPTGSGENGRKYVEQWPGGAAFVIRGDGTTNHQCGFLSSSSGVGSWITYRGIQFRDIGRGGSSSAQTAGIQYQYEANAVGVNVEYCRFDNINSGDGTNTAGVLPWGVDGMKIWRSVADNIMVAGSNTNNNSGGICLTYDGLNISVQRCEMFRTAHGVFHKRLVTTGVDVSLNCRFSRFHGCDAHYSFSGSGGGSHSFSVVQGCVFEDAGSGGIWHQTLNQNNIGVKAGWWCNNVFVNCGQGEMAAIHTRRANGAMIFNNIMLDCRKVWADDLDSSPASDIEFADFNHEHGTTLASQRYEWRGGDYSSASALSSASGHEASASSGDPMFAAPQSGDFSLRAGSPARGSGAGGTDCGLYLVGDEIVGSGAESPENIAPSKMDPVSVESG